MDEKDLDRVELAKTFASVAVPAAQTRPKEYDRLNLLARARAEKVTSHCRSLYAAWAELLPTLDQMQALLSQRGTDREVGSAIELPTWTTWLAGFVADTGLTATVRTVQNHLARFRGLDRQKVNPSDRPHKLTSNQKRRLLTAVQRGNELVEALESGGDYRRAVMEFKRTTFDPDRVDQLLEASAADCVQLTQPSIAPAVPLAGNAIGQLAPVPSGPVIIPPPPVNLPKAGNWSGLADYVSAACGEGLRATLDGLEPRLMAACLQQFAQRLTDTYCTHDRLVGQIRAQVDYIPTSYLARKRAA